MGNFPYTSALSETKVKPQVELNIVVYSKDQDEYLKICYCYITVPKGGILISNLTLLTQALEYMEAHLEQDIKTADIAAACYCSKSTLEKLFRCVNDISVRDYLIRRRMTLAANALGCHPEESILEIGMRYGYSSNEAFTRAFEQIWHCKPSEYRKNPRHFELFPRLLYPSVEMEENEYMKTRKHVDISELYDLFKERNNCFFVCADIKHLVPINDIAREAGDLAIIKSMERMMEVAGEEDVVFRIGGDEFALLTASEDQTYAEALAKEILSHNEEPISYQGQKIPLSLHVSVVKFPNSNLRYSELFEKLHKSMLDAK